MCVSMWTRSIALFLGFAGLSLGIIDWTKLPKPPSFVHEPNDPIVYFTTPSTSTHDFELLKNRTLRCVAKGTPPPRYNWTKNGKHFSPKLYSDRVIVKEGGTLMFLRMQATDEGEYQCLASNIEGTALSEKVVLKQAWIRYFPNSVPEIAQVELGDPFQRACIPPESSPPARVYWIFKGDLKGSFDSINSSHISTNEAGTIFFHHVEPNDSKIGQYFTCTAVNTKLKDYKFGSQFRLNISTIYRRKLSLPVPWAEQYVNQSAPVAIRGRIHKLYCFFSGYPNPIPSWNHNGTAVGTNDTRYSLEAYGRILAFNVTFDSAGTYKCVFPYAGFDRQFIVTVEAKPFWPIGPPVGVVKAEGETAIFDCGVLGVPTPTVTFYKNGIEIKIDSEQGRLAIDGGVLRISDIRDGYDEAGDNAVYQCKVENKHGYIWANFHLDVLALKPELRREPGTVEAIAGREVTLTCAFDAYPPVTINWNHHSCSQVEYHYASRSLTGEGNVTIRPATNETTGEYRCIGRNRYGLATGSAFLIVREPTKLEAFDKRLEVVTAGNFVELPCEAIRDDDLTVSYAWFANGKELLERSAKDGHLWVAKNHSLIMTSVTAEDTAEYTCIAATKLDKTSQSIRVHVDDVPRAVSSLFVVECVNDPAFVMLHFEYTEDSDLVSPLIQLWFNVGLNDESGDVIWTNRSVYLNASEYASVEGDKRVVNGTVNIALRPFENYAFRAFGRNRMGVGPAVNAHGVCETAAAVPVRNPEGVFASGSLPDNLVVSFEPIPRFQWNGPHFHYVIRYRPFAEESDWKEVEIHEPYIGSYTIQLDSDKAYRPYEVQVLSVNEIGPAGVSPRSVKGFTAEGDPEYTPTNFRVLSCEATSVTFAWDPIDPDWVHGNFTAIKIVVWLESERFRFKRDASFPEQKVESVGEHEVEFEGVKNGRTDSVLVARNSSNATISGFRPYSAYGAQISVLNGRHEGAPSTPISFQTKQGVPSAVCDLEVIPMNSQNASERGVVVARWKSPLYPNGRILSYGLEACALQDSGTVSSDCPFEESSGDANSIRIAFLEFNTSYRFTVYGKTVAGIGNGSSVTAKTLPQVPENLVAYLDPVKPGVEEKLVGRNYILVSVTPGDFNATEGRPVGNRMLVKYRISGSEAWDTTEPIGDSLDVVMLNLETATEYEVAAVAVMKYVGAVERHTESAVSHITTTGKATSRMRHWFFVVLFIAVLLLIGLVFCTMAVAMREKGKTYSVYENEQRRGSGFGDNEAFEWEDEEKRASREKEAEFEEVDLMEDIKRSFSQGDDPYSRFAGKEASDGPIFKQPMSTSM